MNKSVYQLYGYTPLKRNGKYIAVCHVCGKNLQNTTISRLKLHRSVCKHLEESYEIEALEESGENNEETVNPLEIVYDTDVKREGNYVPNEDSVAEEELHGENSYDIDIERYMNYVTNESPKLQKATPKRKSDVPQTTPKKKSNIRKTNHNYNMLSNLRNQKIQSEINYIKSKTRFYAQETAKIDFSRTFQLLQIKKLRLDVEQLKN